MKVCNPVFAVNVAALLVRLPPKLIAATPVSFQTLNGLRITSSVKVLVPVLARVKVPVTVVAPPTVSVQRLFAPVTNAAPVLMVRGAGAVKVKAEPVVITPVLAIITPPVPTNVGIHSIPAVRAVVVLYCNVAAAP